MPTWNKYIFTCVSGTSCFTSIVTELTGCLLLTVHLCELFLLSRFSECIVTSPHAHSSHDNRLTRSNSPSVPLHWLTGLSSQWIITHDISDLQGSFLSRTVLEWVGWHIASSTSGLHKTVTSIRSNQIKLCEIHTFERKVQMYYFLFTSHNFLPFSIFKTNIIYLYWTIYTDQFILLLHLYIFYFKVISIFL